MKSTVKQQDKSREGNIRLDYDLFKVESVKLLFDKMSAVKVTDNYWLVDGLTLNVKEALCININE